MIQQLQAGGALNAGRIYIERPADKQLFDALLAGSYCYVLAPRQIGKSSLMNHCRELLATRGVRCGTLDLSAFGTGNIETNQWYLSLIDMLARIFRLSDPSNFWQQHNDKTAVYRFRLFISDILLNNITEPIVIFIDEIDTLLSLPDISKDFLLALRALHEVGARDNQHRQLTFCLLGVATPVDLMIQEPMRTPFNVIRAIQLDDFSEDSLLAFKPILSELGENPDDWLKEVFLWTNGHPYMTQRLCQLLFEIERLPEDDIKEHVRRCVYENFLAAGRYNDASLSDPERRINKSKNKYELLKLYEKVLKREAIETNLRNLYQLDLRLCGFVSWKRATDSIVCLIPRNLIFETVFGLDWVRENADHSQLSNAARHWLDTNKSQDALLSGIDLDIAKQWKQKNPQKLTSDESDYLRASIDWAIQIANKERNDNLTQIEQLKKERHEGLTQIGKLEKEKVHIRRWLICVLVFSGILSSCMTLVFYIIRNSENHSRRQAEINSRAMSSELQKQLTNANAIIEEQKKQIESILIDKEKIELKYQDVISDKSSSASDSTICDSRLAQRNSEWNARMNQKIDEINNNHKRILLEWKTAFDALTRLSNSKYSTDQCVNLVKSMHGGVTKSR